MSSPGYEIGYPRPSSAVSYSNLPQVFGHDRKGIGSLPLKSSVFWRRSPRRECEHWVGRSGGSHGASSYYQQSKSVPDDRSDREWQKY